MVIVFNDTFNNTIYFSYIMAVNFIGGENQNTWIKPLNCHKSLTNFLT